MTKSPEELTKDWKAGKLKEGDYYVQYADGDIRIEYASKWIHPNSPSNMVNFDDPISIYTVLAPVPSYEELIRLKRVEKKYQNIKANGNYPDKISQLKAKIKNLIEENSELKVLIQRLGTNVEDLTLQKDLLIVENNKLRGLLKKCCIAFETYAKEDEACGLEEENKYAKHLLTRIKAAIGESEE